MSSREASRSVFGRGFVAMVPLWVGVAPFGLAYAVLARDAGLSLIETQALSVLVFAGAAQVSAVGLVSQGAAGLEIVLTTFLLNVRHVLYGLSLSRTTRIDGWRRPVAACTSSPTRHSVSWWPGTSEPSAFCSAPS